VNIALFGGTGQVGSRVLTLLLERGDDVVALSLHPEKLPPVEHLKAILGDARDLTAVREAVRGADAVASCLGMANFSTPATDLSDSFKTILEAMAMEGVRRLVFIGSSAGALSSLARRGCSITRTEAFAGITTCPSTCSSCRRSKCGCMTRFAHPTSTGRCSAR